MLTAQKAHDLAAKSSDAATNALITQTTKQITKASKESKYSIIIPTINLTNTAKFIKILQNHGYTVTQTPNTLTISWTRPNTKTKNSNCTINQDPPPRKQPKPTRAPWYDRNTKK